jgi:hypothetical protein
MKTHIDNITQRVPLMRRLQHASSALCLDLLRDMTADAQGNFYVAGIAGSADFPRNAGTLPGQSHRGGGMVAKFSPAGQLTWSRVVGGRARETDYLYSVKVDHIGGTGDEMARACCVGRDGTLYVGGVTTSRDFPTKNAWQAKYGGDPGFGSIPCGGRWPAGWGNGDCCVTKFARPGDQNMK